MTTAPAPTLEDVANTVGALMRFWGFREILGRTWAFLYLSPQPLSAEDLTARLRTSRGNISVALQEMQRWGIVHREPLQGRTKGYSAETDIWRMISRVYREREKYEVDKATGIFDKALKKPLSAFQKKRVEKLRELSILASAVLERTTQASLKNTAATLPLLLKLHRLLTSE